MYNNNNSDYNNSRGFIASPRISFSNDFAESHQYIRQDRNMTAAQPPPPLPSSSSSDFEFSAVSNHSMMSAADELFSQGRILPFKHECGRRRATTTLRDELMVEDDDNYNSSYGDGLMSSSSASKPPKSSTKWKGFLGLKRSHIGSKKPAADTRSSRPVEVQRSDDQEPRDSKTTHPQGLFGGDGSSSCEDVEMGF